MTIWTPTIGSDSPRYAAIVDALIDDIGAGRLRRGDQLPTQRELADRLGVSIGTVTRAYAAAERRGLVRGEIGRGTFVVGKTADSYVAADFGVKPLGVVDLAVTRPLESLDPDLRPILRDLARRPELPELIHYQPNAGMWRHRIAGAEWASRFGVETSPENVLVCAGTQHAINVVLASVTAPGDALFVEELSYPGIRALANLLQLKLVPLPMDSYGLVPETFESACRQRRAKALFTIPTIHNPLTSTIPEPRRREIADIATRHGIAIVEDAIHHLLAEDPPPPLSVFAPENGYFVAAISKVVTGGLRIAYLVPPPDMFDQLTQAVWATNWMTAPLCAEVAATWIEDGTADETVRRKRAEAHQRVEMARDILSGHELRSDDYGHHVWLELREPWESAAQFSAESRHRGVAVAPAEVFTIGGSPANAVRLSLSAPRSRDELSTALLKLARTLSSKPGLGPAIV